MTTLDELARLARNEEASMQQLVEKFLDTVVMLPSGTDPAAEGVTPVLVTLDEVPHIVVSTGEAGLERTRHIAAHTISLRGRDILAGVQPGAGVAVHTDEAGFSLLPEMVEAIIQDYAIKSMHPRDSNAE